MWCRVLYLRNDDWCHPMLFCPCNWQETRSNFCPFIFLYVHFVCLKQGFFPNHNFYVCTSAAILSWLKETKSCINLCWQLNTPKREEKLNRDGLLIPVLSNIPCMNSRRGILMCWSWFAKGFSSKVLFLPTWLSK